MSYRRATFGMGDGRVREQDGFETPCRDCGHSYGEHEPPEDGKPGRCRPYSGTACQCVSFEFIQQTARGGMR